VIERLAIIGVGLIGGSFAAALRARGAVRHVVGVGRNPANLRVAIERGILDSAASATEAVRGADFVLIATPVGQMEARLREIAPLLDTRAVVTDGGSTKHDVVAAAQRALGERFAQFVPGHPIAGAEKSGAQAADATLFAGRRVVLTPVAQTRADALARVRAAWERCGAQVVTMAVQEHDELLAVVSHLPHVLAYALMGVVIDDSRSEALLANAGSGFRDFTRLASSEPQMWRDILIANRQALLVALDKFQASLGTLRAAIEAGDETLLERSLAHSRAVRDAWLARAAQTGGGEGGAP
jgi:prephenate dehydrogenase